MASRARNDWRPSVEQFVQMRAAAKEQLTTLARASGDTLKPEFYFFETCARRVNGKQIVVLDGVWKFFNALICDDSASFAAVYDPSKRKFGQYVRPINLCEIKGP